ncbi:FAD-dependent oxidoreductase [Pseudodesulfovibrio sp. zrk46]|uniref:FAD-dependent oxidoreductase n=1 Tax=Pseudodesulfovibrio sp. zrk46 TaxID=2725288 RepID=UPI0014499601|nr:FAD-dependent oxidoreductase [Pseudodesulfovibrio sp. zrk46]QJB57556.1 FAD-dependent oxidoreductase [Pseudodesulfovibrio sp. zrk46]
MARVVYGVWGGEITDNRGKNLFEIEENPEFAEFDAFNQGNPINTFVGDRGFFVFSPDASLLDALWLYMDKAAEESCGKCTPCRMGTRLIRDRLAGLRSEDMQIDDTNAVLDEVEMLANHVHNTSMCGLGQSCTNALLAALTHFRDQLEQNRYLLPAKHTMTYVTSPCIEACPAKVNVPRYIDYIKDGKPSHSLGVILQKYPMAATCGRVCVRFCEMACQRSMVDEPVGIKTLKRFVADHEQVMNDDLFSKELIPEHQPDDLKVAVVGAGPAGVSCAYHLLLKGYAVDVFEAMGEAGGMASIGIPSYRLPKDVLKSETDIIERLGGRFIYNQKLGRDFDVNELFERGYKSVFLALGCSEGRLMNVDGEDVSLVGYEPGIEFLLRVHDHVEGGGDMELSGDVVIVGGGNVAMDCARSALRMGAENVHLVYRRTMEDMPADHEEIEAAEKEGVQFHFLTNPTRILSKDGNVTGVELVEMIQTESNQSGRRGVEAKSGTEYVLTASTVVPAIGQRVAGDCFKSNDGVKINKWGCIDVDGSNLATSRPGVFAGGDCQLGPSTLIHAMAHGLKASRSIDDYLQLGRIRFFPRSRMRQIINKYKTMTDEWLGTPVQHLYRVPIQEMDPEVRKTLFNEVEQTITPEEAYHEAGRCLRCYRLYALVTEYPIPEGCA